MIGGQGINQKREKGMVDRVGEMRKGRRASSGVGRYFWAGGLTLREVNSVGVSPQGPGGWGGGGAFSPHPPPGKFFNFTLCNLRVFKSCYSKSYLYIQC